MVLGLGSDLKSATESKIMRRHQFVPTALGPLEDRVVLSAAAGNLQSVVHTLAVKFPSFSGSGVIHLANTLSKGQALNLDPFSTTISGIGNVKVHGQISHKGDGQPVTGYLMVVVTSTNESARLLVTAPHVDLYAKSATVKFDYEMSTVRPGSFFKFNGATGHLTLQTSNVSNRTGQYTIKGMS